ncbi:ethanolamine-phosphate phospho-lyase-like isoform X2 [Amphibalanus amphitrite]|uniref:ethanolamine-phosphate phospho-lyase-like isoform X2 n=1 Tax=Amphibalanus amphitrite TaxID=1232801 RepID=UPI001C8FB2CA|nr:ethanolamine-phosphate phospho-lyase-like isoform X2 [Amphibalanus amphitrite]
MGLVHSIMAGFSGGDGQRELTKEEIIRIRATHLSSANEMFFKEDPLMIMRGEGAFLYDEKDNGYLDCINNVCHVGHSNPHVVAAISQQAAQLNTNNRYLHPNLARLLRRLVPTFAPSDLTRVTLVNSGSEANDLALRMARAHTGNEDIITLNHAYHGHVSSTIDVSPYKSKGLGVNSPVVYEAPCPDIYRGKYTDQTHPGLSPEALGELYAQEVGEIIATLAEQGRRPAAFIAESLQSCGGQIIPPPGYLRRVYQLVHAAGGITVADEVQVGFGRVGTHWWAYQTQGADVKPDIVTMGKPMGNGHPVAAVICTEAVDKSFARSGVAYFNTYGGNPVSCAAALAVLDEIQTHNLKEHCVKIGHLLISKLEDLKNRHRLIGDVRVLGMFAGIELVTDREQRTPATAEAKLLLQKMLKERVLLSADGPDRNVIKFKPPIVFSEENVEELVTKLDRVLAQLEGDQNNDRE